MAPRKPAGTNAFERLRDRLDRERRTCPACGYEDDATWDVDTSGDRVRYRHRCPSCDNVETRELHF